MLRTFYLTGITFLCLHATSRAQAPVSAQDTSLTPVGNAAPRPVITGSADAYYRYDLSGTALNNKTSFTNSQNSFELGMASIKVEHTTGSVGMVADVGFGKRAEEFSYSDASTRFIIKQLNLSYALKNGLKFTAGSWATHVGYELVDPYANRNYSMAYMFSYGPFFHTGIKAEKTFGKVGLMLGVANPTDLKSTTLSSKYMIGQISLASSDRLKTYLNFQGGHPNDSTRLMQADWVSVLTLNEKWSLGANATLTHYGFKHGEESGYEDTAPWWGAALYINADPKPWLGITLRSELFNDEQQLNVFSSQASGGSILANTLSFNFKVENLTIIPEIRFEQASEAIYLDKDSAPSKQALSLLMAAVYKF